MSNIFPNEFLISGRAESVLLLIDATEFTESELVDMYLGICFRLQNLIDFTETPVYLAVRNSVQGLTQIESDIAAINNTKQGAIDDH